MSHLAENKMPFSKTPIKFGSKVKNVSLFFLYSMAKGWREAETEEENYLLYAADEGDVEELTAILQMGVCPNVYDVCEREH